MKIAIILGTRPEIIKMASVIRELERRRASYFILHTGQHYSYNLSRVLFDHLELPRPKYNVSVGSGSHAEETGKMLIEIEKVLQQERPSIVLVEGDTNSVIAGALAAVKLHIKVGHVEAGLRSYDRAMPEETNRVVVDHISDYLFAPTERAKGILLSEGISEERIFVTGNTIVDAVYQNLKKANSKGNALQKLGLQVGEYFLVTVHREENVDDLGRFERILEGLTRLGKAFKIPVIYPAHPRSRGRIEERGLKTNGIRLIEPLDFLTFLQLVNNARLVLTDSGGVQEEACILGIPCVTLRDNTERPETLEVGSNILAGSSPGNILKSSQIMLGRENNWENPLGDGRAAEKIVQVVIEGK